MTGKRGRAARRHQVGRQDMAARIGAGTAGAGKMMQGSAGVMQRGEIRSGGGHGREDRAALQAPKQDDAGSAGVMQRGDIQVGRQDMAARIGAARRRPSKMAGSRRVGAETSRSGGRTWPRDRAGTAGATSR